MNNMLNIIEPILYTFLGGLLPLCIKEYAVDGFQTCCQLEWESSFKQLLALKEPLNLRRIKLMDQNINSTFEKC
jgi:hypothetical protein